MILAKKEVPSRCKGKLTLTVEVKCDVCCKVFEERNGNARRRLQQTSHACSRKCASEFRQVGGNAYLKKTSDMS